MIEINLIPDIKQELIRARRVRTYVISGAIVVGVATVALVVILALYLFGVQAVRNKLADDSIASNNTKLQSVEDLSDTLTIQNQLTLISDMHAKKNISSRTFALIDAINPPAPNQVSISALRLVSEDNTISIEGQAANGYAAAETFKKTILDTSLTYRDESNENKSVKLTQDVRTSDISFGEDASGKKVLRFTFSFEYAPELFSREAQSANIERPGRKNVTDSFLRVPESLFSQRIDSTGGNE